jgi:hypothetical protein
MPDNYRQPIRVRGETGQVVTKQEDGQVVARPHMTLVFGGGLSAIDRQSKVSANATVMRDPKHSQKSRPVKDGSSRFETVVSASYVL